MPDNASTELALIKVLSDQLAEFRALSTKLEHLAERLGRLEHQSQHRQDQIMTALETLVASVDANVAGQAALTTAVNALIVRVGTPGPTDAQLLSIAGQVDSSTASDKALTDAANAALNPPPPVP
jgi:predicted nucleic acid-binding Zn ribbon protein